MTTPDGERCAHGPMCQWCKPSGPSPADQATADGQNTAAATDRTKPYLRSRVAGDPCDFEDCDDNGVLIRVNPKGEPGIFMCARHASSQRNGGND